MLPAYSEIHWEYAGWVMFWVFLVIFFGIYGAYTVTDALYNYILDFVGVLADACQGNKNRTAARGVKRDS